MSQITTATPGAVYHRCALQVNPHDYQARFRGKSGGLDEESYAEALVATALDLGVTVLAITDHNSARGVPAIRKVASDRGITVFPGFELKSAEGIHVLCIYAPDTSIDQLNIYLGDAGVRSPGPSSNASTKSFGDIVDTVDKQNGIAVAAHVTTSGGLLATLKGVARISAWRTPKLMAVQIPGSVSDVPLRYRPILLNQDPAHRRLPTAGDSLALAVVNAKDIAEPDDLRRNSATCYIKMSDVSIEGLRQAFLDPESRIRLASDPIPDDRNEILSLTWSGGFLDDVVLTFNPNLNVLIGGRGAGKSTIIESIRYVLGLTPFTPQARLAHDGIIKHVVRSGTKIVLRIQSLHPSKRQYTIERVAPNPPVVRDHDGQISSLLPRDLLPGISIWGQHEILELAQDRNRITELLARFKDRDSDLDERKATTSEQLEHNRHAIVSTQQDIDNADDKLAALPGLQETIQRFKDDGLEDRLRKQRLLVREERIMETIVECIGSFRDVSEGIKEDLPVDRAFLSDKSLRDLPGRDILSKGNALLEQLGNELQSITAQMDQLLDAAQEGGSVIAEEWQAHKTKIETQYHEILRELKQGAVDGEEYIQLQRKIEQLVPLRGQRKALATLLQNLIERRQMLLAEWADVTAAEYQRLNRAADGVNGKLAKHIRMEAIFQGNRKPLFDLLRESVKGRIQETIDRLNAASSFSLQEFASTCRRGQQALEKEYLLTPAQARSLSQMDLETLMRIEELDLPAMTNIRLNTAPKGHDAVWRDIATLSTGQKATAVLLLLFLDSDAPLVVDQPEDDLDNRFVTEGVVPRLRRAKQRRQFLLSTHNANIPVLGDAELIFGVTTTSNGNENSAEVRSEHVGSIDVSSVREIVEEILEGGREAFEHRRRKYGF